jgi:CheY-like chemotaxis protein
MLEGRLLVLYFAGRRRGRARPGPRAPTPGEPQARARRKFSVLVVDDDDDARHMYARFFTFCGARALTAPDGAAALATARHEPPDVIVLDLVMPKVTGWEVLRRLKASPRTRNMPVLVLSGHSERESAIGSGADAYYDKPRSPRSLLDAVRRLLARKRKASAPS